jgi:hypothetical protein
MDEDECEEEIDVDEVVEELQGVGLSEKDSEMGQRGSVEMNKIVVTVAEQDNETYEVDEELQWVGLSQKDSEMGQRESVEMDKITVTVAEQDNETEEEDTQKTQDPTPAEATRMTRGKKQPKWGPIVPTRQSERIAKDDGVGQGKSTAVDQELGKALKR